MNHAQRPVSDDPLSLAIVSTYVPRQCGIATFSRDLVTGLMTTDPELAVDGRIGVIALDRPEEDLRYPAEVVHRLRVHERTAYRDLAATLDRVGIQSVSIQHEYGIFGGPDGRHVLDFIHPLRAPVVTTLHTVLSRPTAEQRAVLSAVAGRSARVVVMADRGRELLGDVYGVDRGRVVTIPHGVPDVALVDPDAAKGRLGLDGRRVALSFGLLGPSKRIELVIEAMAKVTTSVPDAHFVVIGATHPEVRRTHGEAYRMELEELVDHLGLRDHVSFIDRYVSDAELLEWLSACDVFVTAYANEQQITSGTLAYALAAGAAIVSTPYPHARELLGDGRGVLVPFEDASALADRIGILLTDDPARSALRARAHAHARSMTWSRVAQRYRLLLDEIADDRAETTGGRRLSDFELALPPVVRRHLDALSDRDGIFQHAVGPTADPRHGQCTDDVARALLVDVRHSAVTSSATIAASSRRWLTFLEAALEPGAGRFRNVRGPDGRWTEPVGSEDAHGRALQALGAAVARSTDRWISSRADHLFRMALPPALSFTALRPQAYAILGCAEAIRVTPPDGPAASVLSTLGGRLAGAFAAGSSRSDGDWPWPEDIVTYDNGVLPEALIVAGRVLGRDDWLATGLAALAWLAAAQTGHAGRLCLVGNRGWWPRGGRPARFDQQPIEATSMLEAAASAFETTGDRRWKELAEGAYAWFLGANDGRWRLAEPERGACHDGLTPNGVNANQGAESTLCWLLAVERIRELRAGPGGARRPGRVDRVDRPGRAAVRAGRWPVAVPEPGIGSRS
jgi:glycosyltransferase involved in cell wall biosynthesis